MPQIPNLLLVLSPLYQTFPKYLVCHRGKVFRISLLKCLPNLFIRQLDRNETRRNISNLIERGSKVVTTAGIDTADPPFDGQPPHTEKVGKLIRRQPAEDVSLLF